MTNSEECISLAGSSVACAALLSRGLDLLNVLTLNRRRKSWQRGKNKEQQYHSDSQRLSLLLGLAGWRGGGVNVQRGLTRAISFFMCWHCWLLPECRSPDARSVTRHFIALIWRRSESSRVAKTSERPSPQSPPRVNQSGAPQQAAFHVADN